MSKIHFIFIGFLIVLFVYLSHQIFMASRSLEIVFFDVGQGDSILIQKGTKQILIDGGPSGKTELAKLGKYIPYFDREIEIVIATHPDKDHIAGLVEAARNYKIGKVLTTGAEKDTEVFKEWKDVLTYNKVETVEVWRGTEVRFDEGMKIKIIYPLSRLNADAGETNNGSVVVRFDYGNSEFLFTGDIESPAERDIIESGENIDVDVLKVAHHGSKYSSGEAFLDAASPTEAVISVGANNSYGHPTEAVLGALGKRNIRVLRTDELGDIIYTCRNLKCKAI